MPGRPMESEETEALLRRLAVGHLGLCIDEQPYVVPLHYLYERGKIYFHSKRGGLKMEYLQANPQVCFEADELISLVKAPSACEFTAEYRSVIAYGKARLVEDAEEKQAVVNKLAEKYAEGTSFEPTTRKAAEAIAIVEVSISEMTGRANERRP